MAAGEEYVAAITARDSDRDARRAFWDLVLRQAVPGGCIFDLGAGAGIDAKFYAERGFQVRAYDVDPYMRASFVSRCSREIGSGQVQLYHGDYRNFLEWAIPNIRGEQDVNVVTANFAPLNLIPDLRELFAGLHTLTAPGAKIIASVLNADFPGDMAYRWWWANRLQYWWQGQFRVVGASTAVYRRSVGNFAAQADPYFILRSAVRGAPLRDTGGAGSATWMSRLMSRYTFLVLDRRQSCDD
jgi:SAM-dependent methyltransferase